MRAQIFKTITGIALVLLCICIHAQNKTIDSLQSVLRTQQNDTSRVKTLNNLVQNLLRENRYDKAIQLIDEAIYLSQKKDFIIGEATAVRHKGTFYEFQHNTPLARDYYQQAIELFKKMGDKNAVADILGSIASAYAQDQNIPEMVKYQYESLKIYEETGNKEGLAFGYVTLCSNNIREGNLEEAKKNALLALKHYEDPSYKKGFTAIVNSMLADILYRQADYKAAIEKNLESLEGYGKEEQWNKGSVYLGIGNALVKQAETGNDSANRKYKGALSYYFRALKIYEKAGNEYFQSDANIHIGRLYTKLKDYTKAQEYLDKAVKLPINASNYSLLSDAYSAHSELDSARGDFEEAFKNYKVSVAFNDSLHSDDAAKKIAQIRMQYDFDKKNTLVKAEQVKKDAEAKRIKDQQFAIIGGLAFAMLAVLAIVYIQWRNNRQKKLANFQLKQQKEKVEFTLTELKSTQAQLIQSEKMASLGELTAGIAHEIQNPLNFVNNFSDVNKELLAEMNAEIEKGNYDEVKTIAKDVTSNEEKINHHGKRADAIVKGMLQHSRSGTNTKEPTDINKLADEYLRLAYHGLRAKNKEFNATLKTDFDETIGNINIVPQDIGRVILNLITNAFYAVDEKKTLRQTQDNSYEPTVSVSTKKANGKIEIKVSDNGNGISQKVLDKIFQPFFTTKPTGQGTGLGLSLCYDIVKAHHGDIKVQTKESEGSEFKITLPS